MPPLVGVSPPETRTDVLRLTSLFGGSDAGLPVLFIIGAADPWEKVNEGESGPTLDLGLPWDEICIVESLLIQEFLLAENDSPRFPEL